MDGPPPDALAASMAAGFAALPDRVPAGLQLHRARLRSARVRTLSMRKKCLGRVLDKYNAARKSWNRMHGLRH
eukprot:11435458-Alexandrium_andersonii.AAC.1